MISSEFKLNVYKEIAKEFNDNKIYHSAIHGLCYCPVIVGRDLDILISKKQLTAAEEKICEVFIRNNIRYKVIRRSWAFWIIGFKNINDVVCEIEIDLFWQINVGGIKLTDNRYLDVNAERNYEFNIDDWNKFAKVILTKYLTNQIISDENITEEIPNLKDIIKKYKGSIVDLIGINHFNKLYDILIYKNKELFSTKFERVSYFQCQIDYFQKNAIKYLYNLTKTIYWRIDRKFNGRINPYFCLSGPDGVGKSTILSALKEEMAQGIFNKVIIKHWRPTLFPPLNSILRPNNPSFEEVSTFPRKKHGKFTLIRIFYYYFDYLLGYSFIDKKIINNLGLLIYDRHFIDMVVDPVRFGINKNYRKIINLLYYITPKPDYIIYLIANPQIIYDRKQELTISEISTQISFIENMSISKNNNFIFMNAEDTKSNVAHRVVEILYNKLIPQKK